MSVGEHALVVVLWILFGLVHSLLAAPLVKRRAERLMGRYFLWYRPLYSVFALLNTTFILVYLFSMESVQLWQADAGTQSLFLFSAFMGLMVMGISIKKYFFYLSGVQVLYREKRKPVLQTKGLHAWVRHPLYAGTLLFIWSIFFLFPMLHFLLTCIPFTVYTLIGIKLEERKLENLYGQGYRAYKNNVPMIIPFTKFGKLTKAVSDKLS
jgi:protein-S-isoprenylcysteine O-methyltransferase Ste14